MRGEEGGEEGGEGEGRGYLTEIDSAIVSELCPQLLLILETFRQTIHKECLGLQILTFLHAIVSKIHTQATKTNNFIRHVLLGQKSRLPLDILYKPISFVQASLWTVHHEIAEKITMWGKEFSQSFSVVGERDVSCKEQGVWVAIGS